jgi:hypothetical protein
MGSQKVSPRSKSVAAKAVSIVTPSRLSMPTQAASNVPRPSGIGPRVATTQGGLPTQSRKLLYRAEMQDDEDERKERQEPEDPERESPPSRRLTMLRKVNGGGTSCCPDSGERSAQVIRLGHALRPLLRR